MRYPITRLAGVATLALLMTPALGFAGDRGPPGKAPRHQPPRWETKHVETRRTENGHESTTTWTGPDGRTATREASVVRDKDAGTRTRDVTYTGPDGQTRTVNDVTTRTEDGYTRQTSTTGPQGHTTTRNVTATRDGESGTWTRDVTIERGDD